MLCIAHLTRRSEETGSRYTLPSVPYLLLTRRDTIEAIPLFRQWNPLSAERDIQAAMHNNTRSKLHLFLILVLCTRIYATTGRHVIIKRNFSDQSVRGYLAERTCWWNEVCKEEFHSKFRCRCPKWSYCGAPGKYYDAHCTMTRTGYIWAQPEIPALALEIDKR